MHSEKHSEQGTSLKLKISMPTNFVYSITNKLMLSIQHTTPLRLNIKRTWHCHTW